MSWHRPVVAAAIVIFGIAMAWDSGLRGAGPSALTLAWLGTLVPTTAGLLRPRLPALLVVSAASAVLLLAARIVSGAELRWYAMAFVFLVVLLVGEYYERRVRDPSADGRGSSIASQH